MNVLKIKLWSKQIAAILNISRVEEFKKSNNITAVQPFI